MIVHRVGFFQYRHQRFYGFLHWKCYFYSRFFKEWLLFEDFFPRFKSHFRLVQMKLKSITFVQNHKVIRHSYCNNVHLNNICYFVSARNSSLHKLLFEDFFPRFKSHFRLVQMKLKSITFVQNHKVIRHSYCNNVHLNNICYFVSARNSSLHKQLSCVKIKGTIIIHVKFSSAWKLKILRCFRTLHVQILSGFKNWDIQDLTLSRCDTLKGCQWNFFKFCWVVHYRKICKN